MNFNIDERSNVEKSKLRESLKYKIKIDEIKRRN